MAELLVALLRPSGAFQLLGRVDTGFTEADRRELAERLRLVTTDSYVSPSTCRSRHLRLKANRRAASARPSIRPVQTIGVSPFTFAGVSTGVRRSTSTPRLSQTTSTSAAA